MDGFKKYKPTQNVVNNTTKTKEVNFEEVKISQVADEEKETFEDVGKSRESGKKNPFKIFLIVILSIVILIASFGLVFFYKYNNDLKFSGDGKKSSIFVVNDGETLSTVAKKLKDEDLIISKNSFELYSRINGKNNIKAGRYKLNNSMTIVEIADILNEGRKITTFNVQLLPGGTVKMAKNNLSKLGFSGDEINKAFEKDYSKDFPKLFANKPKDADLEGYLYGETHTFEDGATVEDVLRRFLSHFQDVIVQNDFASKFKSQGLNLYEGLTLASIIQKESLDDLEDKKMIAGVFLNRLRKGMNLGSDVTYQYIADKQGVARDVNLDSPYNLRIHTGLTPTPISSPGLKSLKAVAEPAKHDYLFFLSGDDDKTYFGKTSSEHENNIIKYCKKKCQII